MTSSKAGAGDSHHLKSVWSRRVPLLESAAVAVLFLLLFAWLADGVFRGGALQFDLRVRAFVHQFANPSLTAGMQVVTLFGSFAFLLPCLLILSLLFYFWSLQRHAAWLATSMIGELILEGTLKAAFHRTRPEVFFGVEPSGYSFPSGHALGSFCFYGVLAGLLCTHMERRSLRILIIAAAALLILAIGFSRIYLGVHYPTDVLAGYCAAAVWVSTLLFMARASHRN